jgi:curved DNA-binding protein CbpA
MIYRIAPRRLFSTSSREAASFDISVDYYKILGVKQTADEKQIRDAYYAMAKKWHPDLNPDLRNKSEEEANVKF